MTENHENGSRKRFPVIKLIIAAGIVGVVIFLFRYLHFNELLRTVLNWINGRGLWGIGIYALLYVAATVLFLPGSLLTLGGGFLYGLLLGTAVVSVSSTAGALLAFLIGRHLARDAVGKKIEGNSRFKAIDEAVGREGWKIVFLCRLSPVFPFNFLNYAFGLTRVAFLHYAVASWIGMIPGTIMYVYIGSLASDLATLGSGGRTRTTAEWVLYIVGLCATVAVTVYITRIAKKSLNRAIGEGEG